MRGDPVRVPAGLLEVDDLALARRELAHAVDTPHEPVPGARERHRQLAYQASCACEEAQGVALGQAEVERERGQPERGEQRPRRASPRRARSRELHQIDRERQHQQHARRCAWPPRPRRRRRPRPSGRSAPRRRRPPRAAGTGSPRRARRSRAPPGTPPAAAASGAASGRPSSSDDEPVEQRQRTQEGAQRDRVGRHQQRRRRAAERRRQPAHEQRVEREEGGARLALAVARFGHAQVPDGVPARERGEQRVGERVGQVRRVELRGVLRRQPAASQDRRRARRRRPRGAPQPGAARTRARRAKASEPRAAARRAARGSLDRPCRESSSTQPHSRRATE